jgi:Cu2+-containing amine oxidase
MKSYMSDLTRRIRKVIAPLSKAEEHRIMKSVTTRMTKNYRGEAAARFRVLELELSIDKPPRRESIPQRLIRVLVADYRNKQNLEFVLDTQGKIIRLEEYRGLQPAFHRDEIKEARAIAKRDSRLAHVTKRRGVFISDFAPETVQENSFRIVGLSYYLLKARENIFQQLARVLVDLSEQKVVSLESAEAAMQETT